MQRLKRETMYEPEPDRFAELRRLERRLEADRMRHDATRAAVFLGALLVGLVALGWVL